MEYGSTKYLILKVISELKYTERKNNRQNFDNVQAL